MDAAVSPSRIRGSAVAPPSKSYSHRAIILGALARGETWVNNLLLSDDTKHTIDACKALGIKIGKKGPAMAVSGSGGKLAGGKKVFVGNSGTTIRLMSSVAALADGDTLFDGTPEMRKRPMGDLLGALKQLGVQAESVRGNGCPPIHVHGGGLRGGEVSISGETSSQFISSLLISCPYARKPTRIKILGRLKSKPYVDVTLDMMRTFGVKANNQGYKEFAVPTGSYSARNYSVEGDWSSASYYFAAAAVTGSKVTVSGLEKNSVQGDKTILGLLKKMGCSVSWAGGKVAVSGPRVLKGIAVNMADCPDLVPTLAAVAAFAKGTTKITGVGHLRFKETDRLEAPAAELAKAGARVKICKDSMSIGGLHPSRPRGAAFDTYRDHRMAMSMTLLALGAEGKSTIRGAECVSKSFPDFFQRMRLLGAKIELKK